MKLVRLMLRYACFPALLVLFSVQSWAGTWNAFGPQVYQQTTTTPKAVSSTFTVHSTATNYSLVVTGTAGADPLITLNGKMVVDSSDPNVTKPVSLALSNTITVTVRGGIGKSVTVKITGVDNDLPTITAAASPAPNSAGWNSSNVVVTFACSDKTSGVASCTAPVTVSADGANQAIKGTTTDLAGNTASTSITINLDKTAPNIAPAQTPAADSFGWNNTAVTVSFTCADATSGVVSCSGPTTLSTEGANQVVKGTAMDKAGNSASATDTVNIDKTVPTISSTATPAANAAGWNNSNVTVAFTCSDSLSGVATCPAATTVSTEGAKQSISGTATDKAGNTAGTSRSLNIDKTPPAITTALSPAPNGAVWNNSNVTASFTCSDGLSGVASCPAATTITTEGANQSIPGTATDVAGNTATPGTKVNLDKTPPAITASLSPSANSFGWNNTDVTVNFACSDSLSGVASCSVPASFTTEGAAQIAAGTATDRAGNTANTTATVRIDKTPPAITAAIVPAPDARGIVTLPASGFVTVTFTCSDSLSGIASCPPAIQVSTLGVNQAFSGSAADKAGNAANANVTFSVESAPLAVTASAAPPANANGWNNTAVSVSYQCTGGVPPVQCPAAQVVSAEGANQLISATATDAAGQAATATTTISIDKTPPIITAAVAPAPNANGIVTLPASGFATITFTCSDSLSGIGSCPSAIQVSTLGANQAFSGTAADKAGNTAAASVTFSVQSAPLAAIVSIAPPPNANGWNNSAVTVSYQCTGGVPPVQCPAAQTVSIEGANQLISAAATDAANQTATATTTLNIDLTPPVISATVSPTPAANGIINATSATVSFTCSDSLSGIFTCPSAVTVTTTGQQTISGTAIDKAGNTANASIQFTLQPFPPLKVIASASPAPNAAGWNNTPVTVTFQCTGGAPPVSCPAPQTINTDGANQIVTGTATDAFGSTASDSVTVKLDQTPPTVTGTIIPVPDLNGVNLGSATVSFSCSDDLSGIAVCPSPVTISTPGAQTVNGVATDIAGNSSTASIPLNIESIPALVVTASISPAPNAAGWNNAPVTVTFQCVGGLAPVTCPPAQTIATEGANQIVTGTANDSSGATASASATVNLDRTPPVVGISSPVDGTTFNSAIVNVTGAVTDSLSGIAALTCNDAPAQTSAGSFSCSVQITQGSLAIVVNAIDVAGNVATVSGGTINIAGPKLTITSPAPLDLFGKSSIDVTGTIDDSNSTVAVNGVDATVSSGTFTANGVILREGNNLITATGKNAGGGTATASVNVVLDTTPPTVRIDSPGDHAILTSPEIEVTGLVNDVVTGTVNSAQVDVTVNGVKASVANRSFMADKVLLVPGQNVITAAATDRAGNKSQTSITVNLQDVRTQQRILIVSGNDQTGAVGTTLPQPFVVEAVSAIGQPMPNVPMTFNVAKSDGTISAFPQQGRQITLQTDGNGQASVTFQLGTRVGPGNNQVYVTSPGFIGQVMFCASATIGAPTQIHDISGESQKGVIGEPLPEPMVVGVFDVGGNPVSGVPVLFTVQKGGGTLEGSASVTKTTDADGRASAVLVLGSQAGANANVASASFNGLTNPPATFIAAGLAAGSPTNTRVTGIVLDNADQPIPNATASIQGTNLSARTDDKGQFTITGAPVGSIVLFVDGASSTRSENFPFLEFPMVTVAGQDNNLGRPIYLPPLDNDNSKIVGGDEDVTLTMKGVPGVTYTVFARSATFPDGSKVGRLTLSQVHADKVPMIPPNGTAPRLVGTLQPSRIKFDPPVKVQFPNTDGLAAGTVTEIFSFHHDLEQFVSEGTARVSEDGSVIVSDPGFGLSVSGWHGGGGQPAPTGGAGGDPCKDDNNDPLSVTAKADDKDKDFKFVNDNVKFTATNKGACNGAKWDWDFGDNSSHSSDQNPTHTYTQPKKYTPKVHLTCTTKCPKPRTADASTEATAIKLTLKAVSWTGSGQNTMKKTGTGDWSTATFASEGDTTITNPIWKADDSGTVTSNDPFSYVKSSMPTLKATFKVEPTLDEAVPAQVRTLGDITGGDSTSLDFDDTDFSLQGASTDTPSLAATDTISDSVSNVATQMHWSVSLDDGSTFKEISQSVHEGFITWGAPTGYYANPGITAKRVNYVVTVNEGLDNVTDMASTTADVTHRVLGFNLSNFVRDTTGNHWQLLDTTTACDCISLAVFVVKQLKMLGISSAKEGRAYPTGGNPRGDTDATTPETDARGRGLFFFAAGSQNPVTHIFDRGGTNFFEGFFEVTDNGTREAFTVDPTTGPIPEFSGSVRGDKLYYAVIRRTLTDIKAGFAGDPQHPHDGRQYWLDTSTAPSTWDFSVEIPFP